MGRRQRLVDRRQELGLSQERLGAAVGVHVKTVARWEQGVSVPYPSQREALARALRWSMAQVALALGDDGDHEANSHESTGVGFLAQLERTASELRTWEPIAVPGLLQIEAYACALEAVGPGHVPPDEIARRVRRRMARQPVLDRLRFYALLDASVLLRVTGGPDVMAAQVAHLRTMAERPNVDIRVVPLDQRAHAGARGAFMLLGSGPTAVVTEDLSSGFSYREVPSIVRDHSRLWGYLWEAGRDLAEVELQRS